MEIKKIIVLRILNGLQMVRIFFIHIEFLGASKKLVKNTIIQEGCYN